MKIAWIKYTGTIEVGDAVNFISGCADIRHGILNEFGKRGDEVHIHTPMSRDTQKYLFKEGAEKDYPTLKYRPLQELDDDVDLLLVENGADNITFKWTHPEHGPVSSAAFVNWLIASYSGLVFYLQIDPMIPFVFFPENYSDKFKESDFYVPHYALMEDKEWVILSNCKNLELLCELHGEKPRCQYKRLFLDEKISFEHWEFHYASLRRDEQLSIQDECEYGVTYVGRQKTRLSAFKRIVFPFAESGGPIHIYGKWKDEIKGRYPDTEWMGLYEKGSTLELYNASFGSLITGDPYFKTLGFISDRFFEALSSKTLPIIDSELVDSDSFDSTIKKILPEELIKELAVSDGDELFSFYSNLDGTQERVDLVKECFKFSKQYSQKDVVDRLLEIYERRIFEL